MEIHPSVFFLLAGVIIVGLEVLGLDLLNILVGEHGMWPTLILLIAFSSITLGELKSLTKTGLAWVGSLSGLALMAISYIYSTDPILLVKSEVLVTVTFVVLTISFFVTGEVIWRNLYGNKSFQASYLWLNLACVGAIVFFFLIVRYLGGAAGFFLVGASLFATSLLSKNEAGPEKKKVYFRKLNNEALTSLFFGFISGGYISVFFQTINASIIPTGIEFQIFLLFSFSFLAVSPLIVRKTTFTSTTSVLLGILAFVLVWLLLFSSLSLSLPFSDTWILAPLLEFHNYYSLHYFLVFILLILPYIFFALVLPLREREDPKTNHLFFNSAGAVISLAIFGLLLSNADVIWQIIFLLVSFLFVYVCIQKYTKTLLLLGLVILTLSFHGPIDGNILKTSLMVRSYFLQHQESINDVSRGVRVFDDDFYTQVAINKNHGSIGAVSESIRGRVLNIGAYNTNSSFILKRSSDFWRSYLLQNLASKDSKILILGLGNHIVLEQAIRSVPHQNQDNIHVVDNFPSFKDIDFRNVLAADRGFAWEDTKVQFFNQDAFRFLANSTEKYDLIVWNLTVWNFGSAKKLYSDEFFGLIKNHLTDSGVFINNAYGDPAVDCFTERTFKNTTYLAGNHQYPFGVILATEKTTLPLVGHSLGELGCEEEASQSIGSAAPRLGNLFNLTNNFSGYKLTPPPDTGEQSLVPDLYDMIDSRVAQLSMGEYKTRWNHMSNAVDLFYKNNYMPIVKGYNLGASSAVGHAQDVLSLLKEGGDVCFLTSMSASQKILLEDGREVLDSHKCGALVSQITALKEINEKYDVLSFFPGPADYFKGVWEHIEKRVANPERVFVMFHETDVFYLADTVEWISSEANNKGIEAVHLYSYDRSDRRHKFAELVANDLTERDIVFFLDIGPASNVDLSIDDGLAAALKIFSYGNPEAADLPLSKRSIQALFFHPDYAFKTTGTYDACQFTQDYQKSFGRAPDFHGFYMYAIFQILNRFNFDPWEIEAVKGSSIWVDSIMGRTTWDNRGLPMGPDRIYLYVDEDGVAEFLYNEKEVYKCPAQ